MKVICRTQPTCGRSSQNAVWDIKGCKSSSCEGSRHFPPGQPVHLFQGPQFLNHATYLSPLPSTSQRASSTTIVSASHTSSRFLPDKDLASNNVLSLADDSKTSFTLTMASVNLSHQTTDSISPSVPVSISEKAGPPPVDPRPTRLSKSLRSPISLAYTSYIVILCCFFTGLLDSTVFYAYGTFVSGQTGNTILFGLGASTSHTTTRPYRWAKSLIAIVCFSWGCVVFSYTTRALGKRRRGTFILSFVTQAALVLLAAGFIQAEVVEGRLHLLNDEIDWRQTLPIALLSFQSAGQIVASRALGHDTIPTVVLTSMIHDIATDPQLLVRWTENPKRFHRLGAFVAALIGAVIGGFLSVLTGKMQSTLWLVGGLKILLAGLCWAWPAEAEYEIDF